jgi:xylulokinase
MTQSPTLTQLLADTLGVPVAVATVPESASLGCAMLGAVGAGVHGTFSEAVAAMTSARLVEPDPARTAACEERYGRWRRVYDMLQTWTL